MDQEQPSKRQKIKRACDNCRNRKIKCDGEQPCGRCHSSGTRCLYTHVEKKRTVTKKADKASTIQNLNQRMNKMESLITTLIDKLNTGGVSRSPSAEDSNDSASSTNGQSPTSRDVSEQGFNPNSILPTGDANTGNDKISPEKYIGSQSSLSVLSPRGMIWLAEKANDPTITAQFQTIISRSHYIFHNQMKKWMETIEAKDLADIPQRDILNRILESFTKDLLHLFFIISSEEVHEVFETYYSYQEKKSTRRLSNSEMLIMHSIVAIATNLQFVKHSGDESTLASLKSLEEKHLLTAIHYYHKISIIGEGLKSIQGILLLISHTNFSLLPQANYMLIATAIRIAQGIGLHRVESLVGMTEEEKRKRRKIWWYCYLADRTNCLKAGKPLTITDTDISKMDMSEFKELIFENFPKDLLNKILNDEIDLMDLSTKDMLTTEVMPEKGYCITHLNSYFVTLFFHFTSEAYETLFCATALVGKSADQIMEIIEKLNSKLEALNKTIPSSVRPGNPLKLGIYEGYVDYKFLMLHFAYYLHVMIINRMAFKRSWLNHHQELVDDSSNFLPRQERLIKKCLEAARNILKIVQRMDVYKGSLFSISMFVFSSAFFTLLTACLELPNSPESRNDLILIHNTTDILFSKLSVMTTQIGETSLYDIMSSTTKYFLRVGILVYNNANPDKIDLTGLDYELKMYFKRLQEMDPNENRKRKRAHAAPFSPPQPSSLSHVRSTNNQQSVPPVQASNFPNIASRKSSQPNTPDLNNILNDPVGNPTTTSYSDDISQTNSVSSTSGEGFDSMSWADMDVGTNSNVFQQLFPMPNLFIGNNMGEPQGFEGFPGHFEW